MDKYPFTKIGLDKLKKEMNKLKSIERPSIIKAIAEARSHGDLSENAEYHAARERQSFIEGRLLELESVISRAEIIDLSKLKGNRITFGTSVKLVDDETEEEKVFHIVGPYEADLSKNKISTQSPIAKAIIGKSLGENVEVSAPGGSRFYEVIEITIIDNSIL